MNDKFGTSSDVKTVVYGGYEPPVKAEGVCSPMSWTINPGPSLRDHFADTALSKLIARNRDRQLMLSPDECAELAYSLADAMMKAREARR